MDDFRAAAAAEGFQLIGVAPAVEATGYSKLVDWIDAGYAGEMAYFVNRQSAYQHPSGVLAGCKSIVALAFPYSASSMDALQPGQGKIARYVWAGTDYHDVIHPKLKRLCKVLKSHHPDATARGVVDTAPLLERECAQLAGLGWQGKNTLLLNKQLGSYFLLACVLTDIELPIDASHETSHCGKCRACLDACPTDAFPEPGVLDATKCISYLTIEHRGPIPIELREGIGEWLFGCDVCQEVCPWNRKPARQPDDLEDAFDRLDLESLFSLSDDEFRSRFRKTPLWRTRRRGILRNAAIVLGNQANPTCVGTLTIALKDEEPIVRGAVAWALGKIGTPEALDALRTHSQAELDNEVLQEIERALEV